MFDITICTSLTTGLSSYLFTWTRCYHTGNNNNYPDYLDSLALTYFRRIIQQIKVTLGEKEVKANLVSLGYDWSNNDNPLQLPLTLIPRAPTTYFIVSCQLAADCSSCLQVVKVNECL
jgi:hypothetical protein